MNLDKLPARYSKMEDDPNIIGSDVAAVKLARANASRGGNVIHVDSQKELDKATVRPGFLRWKKDNPRLDLKTVQQGAKNLKTKDLMQSLAQKHSQTLSGLGDEVPATKTPAAKIPAKEGTAAVASPGMDMKKIMCCVGCAALGGIIVFGLVKKGVIKA